MDGQQSHIEEERVQAPDPNATAESPTPTASVRLTGLENLPPQYVNFIQTNFDPYTFRLAFGRFLPPLISRPEDQKAFTEEALGQGIKVEMAANLVVVPSILRDMVDVLVRQIALYESRYGPIPRYPLNDADAGPGVG